MKDAFLALDFGMSNVHVTLIDAESAEAIVGTKKKFCWYMPRVGEVELHAEEVWKASESAVADMMLCIPKDVRLLSMTFSFFGDNITPVDADGNALYAMIPGLCGRSEEQVKLIDREIGQDEYARITGNTLSTLSSVSKILWLKEHHPEVFAAAKSFYSVQEFVMHKLGFPGVQDRTMAARKLALDVKEDRWSGPLLELMGISEDRLGTNIVESATVLGKTGTYGNVKFPYELPVTIGCHDVAAAILAAGGDDPDTIGILMGTYEQGGYFSEHFIDGCNDFGDSLIYSCCYSAPFKGKYTVMDAFPTAGALLEWYAKNIYGDENVDIGELIARVPLNGRNPLLFLPYVGNSHGAILGMELGTTRNDIFESLLESLAFQFAACMDYLRSTREEPFTRIR
ncbi:MAG: hypothetical protein LUE31_02595, partial [Lachnospiraceae bacterium]|nr:hypothetical protein [Lachnospiraceae bacterium]